MKAEMYLQVLDKDSLRKFPVLSSEQLNDYCINRMVAFREEQLYYGDQIHWIMLMIPSQFSDYLSDLKRVWTNLDRFRRHFSYSKNKFVNDIWCPENKEEETGANIPWSCLLTFLIFTVFCKQTILIFLSQMHHVFGDSARQNRFFRTKKKNVF